MNRANETGNICLLLTSTEILVSNCSADTKGREGTLYSFPIVERVYSEKIEKWFNFLKKVESEEITEVTSKQITQCQRMLIVAFYHEQVPMFESSSCYSSF